jgi:NADH-quinone oxidoreductase subunit J
MTLAFIILSFLLIVSAIGVVGFKNPIFSALSLVANLFLVAVIFATLEAHFLATVQIIVYAGAIMVLVLFVLMLLNLKVESLTRQSVFYVFCSIITAVCFVGALLPLIGRVFGKMNVGDSGVVGTVQALGRVLYVDYVFPFEAASILIMAAIIGAVMLAKRNPTEPKRNAGV